MEVVSDRLLARRQKDAESHRNSRLVLQSSMTTEELLAYHKRNRERTRKYYRSRKDMTEDERQQRRDADAIVRKQKALTNPNSFAYKRMRLEKMTEEEEEKEREAKKYKINIRNKNCRSKALAKRSESENNEYRLKGNEKSRVRRRTRKLEVIVAYGGGCERCGETGVDFLNIDHIEGGGYEHRKTIKSSNGMYNFLHKVGYPDGYQVLCWSCNWIKWLEALPEKDTESTQRWRPMRDSVIEKYGAVCTCCGQTDKRVLTIDHVNNNGASHRKSVGSTTVFYKFLRDNSVLPEFTVLCRNCNCAKGMTGRNGICPHQKLSREAA